MSTPEIKPEQLHEGKRVLIALPWYKSASPLTSFAIMAMMDRRRMAVALGFGDAFIAHSRNKLATQFVNSTIDWMLMIDDDTIPPFGDAQWFRGNTGFKFEDRFAGLHTIDRLISHGKTICGATYFGRYRAGHPVFAEGIQMEKLLKSRGPIDEVRPTKWVGTGCCLFHRSVFLDIEKEFPHLSREANAGTGQWFTSSEHDLHVALDLADKIFEDEGRPLEARLVEARDVIRRGRARSKVNSGMGMGEDVQCCVRATQAGHQPHVDLGLWCGHVGGCVYPILS